MQEARPLLTPAFGSNRSKALVLVIAMVLLAGCQQEQPESPVTNAIPQINTEQALAFFIENARLAMNAEGVDRLEYSGHGWEACLGQPWNINEGWAPWTITDYSRVIDYISFSSLQTAERQAGMIPEKLGGCGAQPEAAAQNQQSSVNADSSFEQKLQVTLTPLGFLALAESHGAIVRQNRDGMQLILEDVDGEYRLEGSFGNDMLLDRIITWVDNTVFGAMPFEAEFYGYSDGDGIRFPARIVQKQGGFATLDITIDAVIANSTSAAEPPERQGGGFGGGGGQNAEQPAYEQIGEGVYALLGAYQSVIVEFDEFSVVLDGLQNESRVTEIINLTKELIPGKPIDYVLVSHAHFDHASGLRQFVAEGATIITHETNADFFEDALNDAALPVRIQSVDAFHAIDDGAQRVEFHKLNGSLHADDILIAYIPSIKTIVEADLMQPWINPFFGGAGHPFLVYLADELDRLGLDYEQFVPVHRPPEPPLMTRADLMAAAERE